MASKCKFKEVEKKGTLRYDVADFEIDREPSSKKPPKWETIGKAEDVIRDLSAATHIHLDPFDTVKNPDKVLKVLNLAMTDVYGWRIKPIIRWENVVIECVGDGKNG